MPATIPLMTLIRGDLAANSATFRANPQIRPSVLLAILRDIATLRWAAVFLFRLAGAAGRRAGFVGLAVKQLNQMLTGADVSWEADIGPGLVLRHPVGVVIGPYVRAGSGLTLQQGITLGGDGSEDGGQSTSPRLGNSVFVGAGARVLGDIELGDDAVVGANAVVITDVPSGAFVAGIPAVVKRPGRSLGAQ